MRQKPLPVSAYLATARRAASGGGRSGAGLGDRLDAAPRSAWSGRIVIAKPVDPTREQVNEMSAAGGGGDHSSGWEPRSAPARGRYTLTPKSCPTRAGRLKAATSRAMSSSSRPKNGMT